MSKEAAPAAAETTGKRKAATPRRAGKTVRLPVVKDEEKAWVVTANMGLGHQRAAWPLRILANHGVVTLGKDDNTTPSEVKLWQRMRSSYEFLSRTKSWPLIGNAVFGILDKIQNIPRFYPIRDMSGPNYQVGWLKGFIEKGLCSGVLKQMKQEPMPMVTTFYAPAIAADMAGFSRVYCVICDAEVNRIWVAEKPLESKLQYFAPCGRTVRRLKQYGVPDERIFLTGFPMPLELLGNRNLDVLRSDMAQRLHNLDPKNRFWPLHGRNVSHFLGEANLKNRRPGPITITFGIGGAGAQGDIAYEIARSLRDKIIKGEVRYNILGGTRPEVAEFIEEMRADLKCPDIRPVCGKSLAEYFQGFTEVMHTTDLLWTKPSELSFYAGLGIPIILAPVIGSQEVYNQSWLLEIQAGVPQGDPKYTDQWLYDLLNAGRLADAAWDGFLKARKYGTYKIMEILASGTMERETSVLKR